MYSSTYFTYKGINSKEYNLKIVTMEKTYTEVFGIKKDIQMESRGDGRIFSYKSTNKTPETRQLIIAHCDEWDRPLKHDIKWRREVSEWLLTGEFIPIWFDEFEDDDLCYYIKILDISRWDNFNKQGYLTITFQPLDDCMYTRPFWKTITAVQTNNFFTINNESNIRSVNPYMEIEPRTTTLKIKNLNLNTSMEFINIPLQNNKPIKFEINNDLGIFIPVYQDYEYNNFNFNWFELKKGMNTIQIEGKCVIDMQLSFPIML